MYHDDELEIWNLTKGIALDVAPQEVVPVVGCIFDWRPGVTATYRLNAGPERPVAVSDGRGGRLSSPGDFGIDSINRTDLRERGNILELTVHREQYQHRACVSFDARKQGPETPRFELDARGKHAVEEIGQVVDGRWTLQSTDGQPELGIAPGDEGYDRIILFGDANWTTGYEVITEFTIDQYLTSTHYHVFGPVFKWRPHAVGDGTALPRTWTSGLGVFSASSTGLTMRYGVDVTYKNNGQREGNHVVAAKRASTLRFARNRVIARLPGHHHVPEFPTGRRLRMRLLVDAGRHELTMEPVGWRGLRRRVDLVVPDSPELIASGAVGFLASYCAVRIHRFSVRPVRSSDQRPIGDEELPPPQHRSQDLSDSQAGDGP
jgi:hypothetical protein